VKNEKREITRNHVGRRVHEDESEDGAPESLHADHHLSCGKERRVKGEERSVEGEERSVEGEKGIKKSRESGIKKKIEKRIDRKQVMSSSSLIR
jgi:hypothetical protein